MQSFLCDLTVAEHHVTVKLRVQARHQGTLMQQLHCELQTHVAAPKLTSNVHGPKTTSSNLCKSNWKRNMIQSRWWGNRWKEKGRSWKKSDERILPWERVWEMQTCWSWQPKEWSKEIRCIGDRGQNDGIVLSWRILKASPECFVQWMREI